MIQYLILYAEIDILMVSNVSNSVIFSLPVGIYWKSYCTTPGVGIGSGGGGVNKMFLGSSFYVMGKARTGELFGTRTGLVIQVCPLNEIEIGLVKPEI